MNPPTNKIDPNTASEFVVAETDEKTVGAPLDERNSAEATALARRAFASDDDSLMILAD